MILQDPLEPQKFELELAQMLNGTVTDSGDCLAAVNTSDANGTGLAWPQCAAFNTWTQMLELG